ncbi:MAG TPA: BamA/TamA family outer membrane protein [Sphingobacteriaceae bacterium]|nr:BamA/TamA family outer membrane protein [Sphingobacteriaceae bacterium]
MASASAQVQIISNLSQSITPLLRDTTKTDDALEKLSGNKSGFFPAIDLRAIDGLFLGIGYKLVSDSTKGPISVQKISAMKNLNSEAVQAKYTADFKSVFGSTDVTVDAFADIKGNILNFFGRGNDTFFDDSDGFRKFYRVKFSLFQITPALRFNLSDQVKVTVGPSVQHSTFDPDDNTGRFINDPAIVAQYQNLHEDKTHGGLVLNFSWDTRNNMMLPTRGVNFSVLTQAYTGLNEYSNGYAQIFPQFSVYNSLDAKGNIVLANRFGAGFTTGKTAFYQSAFLGSQDNLLGYRKFRFAGDNLIYNNLETRISLLDIKGKRSVKAGLIGFYDVGRVWIDEETSNSIHHGYGGGIFLSPLNRILARIVAGFSREGMQLTAAVRQRF